MPNELELVVNDQVQSLQSLRQIVKTKEKPFQIFVKTISGKTITINNMLSTTPIITVMQVIEEKDGLPTSIQRLNYAGKELTRSNVLKDYNIEKGVTLMSLLRLVGGVGERKAMDYILSKGLNRGNVLNEILDTAGASRALKDWGRSLKHDTTFLDKILDKLGLVGNARKDWLNKNYLHVCALIHEIGHSGNCGDFAQVTHSRLTATTSDQYVYMLTMCNPYPDHMQDPKGAWMTDMSDGEKKQWCEANYAVRQVLNKSRELTGRQELTSEDPYEFDHQMCITYPTLVGSLAAMDKNIATIADGWDGNMVCSLATFISGKNAYGMVMDETRLGLSYPNLKISSPEKATNSGGLGGQKDLVKDIIEDYYNDYIASPAFVKAKEAAKKDTSGLFDMNPRTDVNDLMSDDVIKKKLNAYVLPGQLTAFINECNDLEAGKLCTYWTSVVLKEHGLAIMNDRRTKAKLYNDLNDLPARELGLYTFGLREADFMDYLLNHLVDHTKVLSSFQLTTRVLAFFESGNQDQIITIGTNLNEDVLSNVFSCMNKEEEIKKAIHILWGHAGTEAKGDICMGAIAHTAYFKGVLSTLSVDDLEAYLTRQDIWNNKIVVHGSRKGNKPAMESVVQAMDLSQLKAFRSKISLEQWTKYVVPNLTSDQASAL